MEDWMDSAMVFLNSSICKVIGFSIVYVLLCVIVGWKLLVYVWMCSLFCFFFTYFENRIIFILVFSDGYISILKNEGDLYAWKDK